MEQIIGAIWFLLAMAVATYILNRVYNKKGNWIYVVIIAFVGYKTSKYIWLPFSLQAGMTATLFLYIGTLFNKYKVFDKKIDVLLYIFLLGIVIFCMIYGGKLYMVSNIYTNGLMDVIGALAGSFLCIKVSILISKYSKIIKRILIFFGKNSLLCLCIHIISLDCFGFGKVYNFLKVIGIKNNTIKQILANIFFVVIILIIINILKKIIHKINSTSIWRKGG